MTGMRKGRRSNGTDCFDRSPDGHAIGKTMHRKYWPAAVCRRHLLPQWSGETTPTGRGGRHNAPTAEYNSGCLRLADAARGTHPPAHSAYFRRRPCPKVASTTAGRKARKTPRADAIRSSKIKRRSQTGHRNVLQGEIQRQADFLYRCSRFAPGRHGGSVPHRSLVKETSRWCLRASSSEHRATRRKRRVRTVRFTGLTVIHSLRQTIPLTF